MMSNWLNQLQSLLGQGTRDARPGAQQGLSNLLIPGALGGLAGLLVSSKSSRKLLAKYGTGALLVGGGAVVGTVLWNKYKGKMQGAPQEASRPADGEREVDRRTERLILALVFAAKSDGQRAAIDGQLREAGIEAQGRALIDKAIAQPLEPELLARDVSTEEEALELYFLSCAAIDIDHFMERSYLSALGDALKIPPEVREDIERDLAAQKRALQAT